MCVGTYTHPESVTVASPCAWIILDFVLLPMTSLKGYRGVLITFRFFTERSCFLTELLLHLFASILALVLFLSSPCSFGDKYV